MTQANLVADAEKRRLVLHAMLQEKEEKLHQMQQAQHDSAQHVKRPLQQASEAGGDARAEINIIIVVVAILQMVTTFKNRLNVVNHDGQKFGK